MRTASEVDKMDNLPWEVRIMYDHQVPDYSDPHREIFDEPYGPEIRHPLEFPMKRVPEFPENPDFWRPICIYYVK